MKDAILVLAAVVLAYGLFKLFNRPEPVVVPPPVIVQATPPPTPNPTPRPTPIHHFAPDGTFYMVEYVSMRTPRGVAGFEPGRMVHFVSADESKGTLLVSDGEYQVPVLPTQLTNDLDVAALARRQDQDSQHQLQVAQENAKQADAQAKLQTDIDHARNVAAVHSGAVIGRKGSALDEKSSAASSFDREAIRHGSSYYGSPYYYLHRNNYR